MTFMYPEYSKIDFGRSFKDAEEQKKFGCCEIQSLPIHGEGLFSLFEKESRDDDENVRIKLRLLYSYQERRRHASALPRLDSYSR